MSIANQLIVGLLNILLLVYIIFGIFCLMILTVFNMGFCWSKTISDSITDVYKSLADHLRAII